MTITTKRLGAVTAAAVIIITLIWYVALFRPESARISNAHKAYATATSKASDLQTQVGSLEALVRKVPADTARLAQVKAALPTSADIKDLLTELDGLAGRSGVQLTSLSPSVPSTTAASGAAASGAGGAQTISLPMSVTGSYPALMSFLTGLENLPRALVVTSISLSPGGASSMTASLSTKIFYAS